MKSGFHVVPAGPERPGCGAGGACVTEVRFLVPVAPVAGSKLTREYVTGGTAVADGSFHARATRPVRPVRKIARNAFRAAPVRISRPRASAPPHAPLRPRQSAAFPGTKKPTPMTQLAPASLPVWLSRVYCGCGSDRRLLSSCMSTATLASASACWRPWCAQKSSSPELASSTRTYAWAPQRSQTSSAVSGLVGASAPVNVAFPRVVPPASASVWLRFSVLTAQHNTYPGVSVPRSEWCTPQAKPPADGAWPQLPPLVSHRTCPQIAAG